MKLYEKIVLGLLCVVMLAGIANSATRTTFNPFTGKQDYVDDGSNASVASVTNVADRLGNYSTNDTVVNGSSWNLAAGHWPTDEDATTGTIHNSYLIDKAGGPIRFIFLPPHSGTETIHRAYTGFDNQSSFTGTPVRVTFNGNTSVTLSAGDKPVKSDPVELGADVAVDDYVGFRAYVTGRVKARTLDSTGWTQTGDVSNTTTKLDTRGVWSGASGGFTVYCAHGVEVLQRGVPVLDSYLLKGDSITRGSILTDDSSLTRGNWSHRLNRVANAWNAGYGSQSPDEALLTMKDYVYPGYMPQRALIFFTNFSPTEAQMYGEYVQMIEYYKSLGMGVAVGTITPRTTYDATDNGIRARLNNWFYTHPLGVGVRDFARTFHNTTSLNLPPTDETLDGIHPNNTGNQRMFGAFTSFSPASITDATATESTPTIYVNPVSGHDAAGSGTAAEPCKTIGYANTLYPGKLVNISLVTRGTYTESQITLKYGRAITGNYTTVATITSPTCTGEKFKKTGANFTNLFSDGKGYFVTVTAGTGVGATRPLYGGIGFTTISTIYTAGAWATAPTAGSTVEIRKPTALVDFGAATNGIYNANADSCSISWVQLSNTTNCLLNQSTYLMTVSNSIFSPSGTGYGVRAGANAMNFPAGPTVVASCAFTSGGHGFYGTGSITDSLFLGPTLDNITITKGSQAIDIARSHLECTGATPIVIQSGHINFTAPTKTYFDNGIYAFTVDKLGRVTGSTGVVIGAGISVGIAIDANSYID